MATERSAGVITYHHSEGNQKFLLLHYQSGHWGFPKGHIEKGETEEQAALRELSEETGLDRVFLLNGFRDSVNYYFNHNGETVYKEVVFFMAESPSKEVLISDEHIGFRWLPYETAIRALTFKNEQELLTKANTWLKTKKPSHGGSFSGHAAIGKDV